MARVGEVSATPDTTGGVRDRFVRTAKNPRVWVLVASAVTLLATNAGFAETPVHDAVEYGHIANAAPGLPAERIGSAFSARFFIHYLVGLIAHFSGVSVSVVYGLVLAVLIGSLLVIIFALFGHLSVGDFAICTALVVLNPFSLRPYLLQIQTLQDIVFVLGVGICLLGLRNQSVRVVAVGLVVAVLGRQTAILVAPVAAIWILRDPGWRHDGATRRLWPASLLFVAVTATLYVGIAVLTASFSFPNEPSLLHDSILNLVVDLPSSASSLGAHLARTAIPLIVSFAIFCALVTIVGWRNVRFATWGGALMALAIASQPAAVDPGVPGFVSNEQRLAALAILPLVYAVAELFCETERRRESPWTVMAIVAVIAAASLNYKFASIGPKSLTQFVALELFAAVAVAILVIVGYRRCDTAESLDDALRA